MLDVDDLYPEHPKLVGLGTWCEVAGWLNLAALCWCKRYLTDGVLPRAIVWRLAAFRGMAIDGVPVTPEAVAAKLVEARLWKERGPDYLIHDFLEYQESKDAILARREAFRRRQRKHRASEALASVTPSVTRDISVTHASVTRDSGVTIASPSPSPSIEDPDARARATQVEGRTRAREPGAGRSVQPARSPATAERTRRGPARAAPSPPRVAGPPMRLGDILTQAMAAAGRAPPAAVEVPTGVGVKS
jgi:hypothetical protein